MRVTVVGAGVFGAWIAKFLVDDGHEVTLVEAYGPANGRASSCDHSRVIRAGYGADEIYARWAAESLQDWKAFGASAGLDVFTKTGALFLGEPGHPYIRATRETLGRLQLPAQLLDRAELGARFPQLRTDGLGDALLEEEAGALRARAAIQALVRALTQERGVRFVTARVPPLDEQRAVFPGALEGRRHHADAWIFACGPWLPGLFPQAIGARIRPTRQEVLYFGVPAGSNAFAVPRLPVWIDFPAGYYGIPDLDARGFKIGVDRHGPVVDPDRLERVPEAAVIARTREWMAHRFPGLAGAPLVDARVCQYENTANGDFLIDRHPMWPQCWIAGGGSGHGFKHGPAVARHVAGLVTGRAEVLPRFALAGKAEQAGRTVF